MQIKPTTNTRISQSYSKHSDTQPNSTDEHGPDAKLLSLPSETLTHVTSYLDPLAILSLGRTNRQLHEHVNDDNTWRRAFQRQFLGTGPEFDIERDRLILLRRTESSWKKEFILRWNLLRRWGHSRSPTVTHTPLHSTVNNMHLMGDASHGPALLTASLQYGVVARSQPLTGKVLKGYLDASGTVNGLGIGNPNVEFSPDVTACAIASEGRTAKVLWGFVNGDVAVTIAAQAMDAGRAVGRQTRCSPRDRHHARVLEAIWALGGAVCITASGDGHVKIWESKRVQCLWTSETVLTDPCIKLAADLANGYIVAATRNGELLVWTGLTGLAPEDPQPFAEDTKTSLIRIPYPSAGDKSSNTPKTLILDQDSCSASQLAFIIHYAGESVIYRFAVNAATKETQITRFKGGPLGPVESIFLFNHTGNNRDSSALLAGDTLGRVSIYDLNAGSPTTSTTPTTIGPSRLLEAHDDGSITSLACNAFVLITGSSRGTLKVFNILTLALLRFFPSLSARPRPGAEWDAVAQVLLLRDDGLVASAGSRVMCWKAGPAKSGGQGSKKKSGNASAGRSAAKWRQQIELKDEIRQSQLALKDERDKTQRSITRHREHLSTLESLGLNEGEALEYVLMLSREEAQLQGYGSSQGPSTSTSTATDSSSFEGVFQDDFQDIPNEVDPESEAHFTMLTSGESTPAPSPPASASTSISTPGSSRYGSPTGMESRSVSSSSFGVGGAGGGSYGSASAGASATFGFFGMERETERAATWFPSSLPHIPKNPATVAVESRPVPLQDTTEFPSITPPRAPALSIGSRSVSGSGFISAGGSGAFVGSWSQIAQAASLSPSPSLSPSRSVGAGGSMNALASRRSSATGVRISPSSPSSWKTAVVPTRSTSGSAAASGSGLGGQSLLSARMASYQSRSPSGSQSSTSAGVYSKQAQEDEDLRLAIELSMAEYASLQGAGAGDEKGPGGAGES